MRALLRPMFSASGESQQRCHYCRGACAGRRGFRQGALVACDGTTLSHDDGRLCQHPSRRSSPRRALHRPRVWPTAARRRSAGSGKSTLINELAHRLGQSKTLVRVHMDEQIDSKVLLGTYVCSEGAGEFTWQPGVVSQAVANGRWLLLEDVDRAPLEVMAALAPLLEGGSLYLPGRSSSLRPPSGFRLFGTVTIHAARASAAAAVARSVYRPTSWQHIHVPPPTFDDLTRIVARRYPLLAAAASSMVGTLFALVKGSAEMMRRRPRRASTPLTRRLSIPRRPTRWTRTGRRRYGCGSGRRRRSHDRRRRPRCGSGGGGGARGARVPSAAAARSARDLLLVRPCVDNAVHLWARLDARAVESAPDGAAPGDGVDGSAGRLRRGRAEGRCALSARRTAGCLLAAARGRSTRW